MSVASRPVGSRRPQTAAEPVATHEEMVNAIRMLAADAVQRAKSGHPGMPMGMANAATVLWTRFLKFDPRKPDWEDRDRFILSAGHGSMLLYALLYLTGYAGDHDRRDQELPPARLENARAPGVRDRLRHRDDDRAARAGPRQRRRHGARRATAQRRWGDDIVDHYTYCIVGDGCLMEGLSQEAISLAGLLGWPS